MLSRLVTPIRLFALATICLGAYSDLSAVGGDFNEGRSEDTLYDRQDRYRQQTQWQSGENPVGNYDDNPRRRQGRYAPYRSPYYNNSNYYYNNDPQ